MTDLIHRLTTWVSLLLIPRGVHRARPACPSPTTVPPQPRAVRLPTNRSPYGLDTPLDATASRSVRPYVIAHEQWCRRRGLPLATLGLDTHSPYSIHRVEAA